MNTKHLTILISDIEGFTDKTAHLSRQELGRLLSLQDRLVRPIIIRFKGKVVKTIGDAYLVTFTSPTNAVLCGLTVQEALANHNRAAHPKARLHMRIAINSGEVNVIDQDVYGTAVNIAARLQALTQPGRVYLTHSTYTAINPIEVQAVYLGTRNVKGIADGIKIYMAGANHAKNLSTLWAKFKRMLLPGYAGQGISLKLRFALLLMLAAFTVSTISMAANLEAYKKSLLSDANVAVSAQLDTPEASPVASAAPVKSKFSNITPTTSTTQAPTDEDQQTTVTYVTNYTYTTVVEASPVATPTASPLATPVSSLTPEASATVESAQSPSPDNTGGSQTPEYTPAE